ncbi:GNAT family N-acetyltransferase [Streptomyces sp. NPDC050560]|uniref:GNAT family N-acetyltransferase n=1 Tax=Streptomyces sp. NPDC050560 TaxID=3365630 RepID=UPI0037ACDB9C
MDTFRVGTLTTARLTLIPLAPEHADEMARVLRDPALHTFTGGEPLTADALRERYTRLAAGSPDPATHWLNHVVELRAERRLTGTVQATVTRDGTGHTAELAWVTGTPWQRRGIATEAVRALAAALAAAGADALAAHIHPGHHASAAVATALGLTPTDERHDGEIRWHRAL